MKIRRRARPGMASRSGLCVPASASARPPSEWSKMTGAGARSAQPFPAEATMRPSPNVATAGTTAVPVASTTSTEAAVIAAQMRLRIFANGARAPIAQGFSPAAQEASATAIALWVHPSMDSSAAAPAISTVPAAFSAARFPSATARSSPAAPHPARCKRFAL